MRPRATPITDPTTARRLDRSDIVLRGCVPSSGGGDGRRQLLVSAARPIAFNPGQQLALRRHARRPDRRGHHSRAGQQRPRRRLAVRPIICSRFAIRPRAASLKSPMRASTSAGCWCTSGRLYGTGVIYYDANNTQELSHFSRSLKLTEPSVTRNASRRRNGSSRIRRGLHGCSAAGMAVGARRAGDHRPMLRPDRLAHLMGTGRVRVGSGRASGAGRPRGSRPSSITPAITRRSACGKARTQPTEARRRWAAS